MSRHFYPQNVFAKSILKHVETGAVPKKLLDVPCGNGETSWHFSRNKGLLVYGYDIDRNSVETAKSNYKAKNLLFETKGIFEVIAEQDDVDYFCIINSLFLLPEPERILREASGKIRKDGLLCIIVPNVEGRNFKWFNSRNPDVNKLILHRTEFESYFAQQGLQIKSSKALAYAHTMGRRDIKFFSIFSHFYLYILNFFQTRLSIGKPNYYLIVLKKGRNEG